MKYTLILDASGYGHYTMVLCKNEEQKDKIKKLYDSGCLGWVRSLEIIEGYAKNLLCSEKIRASLFLKEIT